jgi:hypothetical protein
MLPRLVSSLALLAVLQVTVSPALAQPAEPTAQPETAPPPRAANGASPDVVRLHKGGLLRGTISELVPGEYVVLVLLTGEVRKLAMADVAYAGPADELPKMPGSGATGDNPYVARDTEAARSRTPSGRRDAARPFVAVHGREVRLSLRANERDVSFYVKTSAAVAGHFGYNVHASGYTLICTAPCEASLPEGRYTFALAKKDGKPVVSRALTLRGDRTLRGQYRDRSGLRVGGWILFGTSLGLGSLMYALFTADQASCELEEISSDDFEGDLSPKDCSRSTERLLAGLLMAVGGTAGLVMGLQGDKATISSRINRSSVKARPRIFHTVSSRGERTYSPGFALSVRF